ncbi:MAG: tRNA uridine-5-carboxymethylaminomethyl(34) synthesis GTPase MnmE [Muribaculaceae bacterium]|nr:tRNA uridine-5-carboxymethylaminomethyl(34) synthesis GTPase MnmE [Muribaculaceae bacterium]
MEPVSHYPTDDTIAAISTPPGVGGIAVVRVSGPKAFQVVNDAWKGTDLLKAKSHTVHLGKYYTLEGNLLDEGVATVFKAPNSFTGEDVVEIGIHGSTWIQRQILEDLVKRGIRIALPGEFTQRAFLNSKIDLAQAEGVADLIAASSKAAHALAMTQTRGSFSREFNSLRDKLIEFASLLELELDFSEEDLEFANRAQLMDLCREILSKIKRLASSYSRGAVLKNGVPVVIAGVPNAGKSSLLNLLLNDDKAIITDIPGTTRDIIEDVVEIKGILFRFIDTAGIRETEDIVERLGVDRAKDALDKAFITIWMLDVTQPLENQLIPLKEYLSSRKESQTNSGSFDPGQIKQSDNIIVLLNKSDLIPPIESQSQITDKEEPSTSHRVSEHKETAQIESDQIVVNQMGYQEKKSYRKEAREAAPEQLGSEHIVPNKMGSEHMILDQKKFERKKSEQVVPEHMGIEQKGSKQGEPEQMGIERKESEQVHANKFNFQKESSSQKVETLIKTLPSSESSILDNSQERNLITTTQKNFKDFLCQKITKTLPDIKEGNIFSFSTQNQDGLEDLLTLLQKLATSDVNPEQDVIVTNARHYEALTRATESLTRALHGLETSLSPDFIAQDIREATAHLSTVTGSITSDTLLHSIFSRFCIGK